MCEARGASARLEDRGPMADGRWAIGVSQLGGAQVSRGERRTMQRRSAATPAERREPAKGDRVGLQGSLRREAPRIRWEAKRAPAERSEPAKRRASDAVGEFEGRSPSMRDARSEPAKRRASDAVGEFEGRSPSMRDARSEPAKRRASEAVGEFEGRSPSTNHDASDRDPEGLRHSTGST